MKIQFRVARARATRCEMMHTVNSFVMRMWFEIQQSRQFGTALHGVAAVTITSRYMNQQRQNSETQQPEPHISHMPTTDVETEHSRQTTTKMQVEYIFIYSHVALSMIYPT